MRLLLTVSVTLMLAGCAASNYAHQNFDMVENQKFIDPDTKQEYYIRDKPSESRMKLMLGAGSAMGMLVVGRNGVPPMPLFEAAAIKYLASQGRSCTPRRSFEIVMAEIEVQYSCS